jgi:hypothetical protein
VSARYFWLSAKAVAGMQTNRARHAYVDLISRTRGPEIAARLKLAAKQLMGVV